MLFLIVVYLLAMLGAAIAGLAAIHLGFLPPWAADVRLVTACALTGGTGGCVYCLRAVYIHKSAENNWNSHWHTWFFLRPIVSFVCGGVSFLFLKAGLLILESKTSTGASEIGYYALSFIAGLNVDKFVAKLEEIAQAVWGIEKSRAAKAQENKRPAEERSASPAPVVNATAEGPQHV
jgi:hypothetical protein